MKIDLFAIDLHLHLSPISTLDKLPFLVVLNIILYFPLIFPEKTTNPYLHDQHQHERKRERELFTVLETRIINADKKKVNIRFRCQSCLHLRLRRWTKRDVPRKNRRTKKRNRVALLDDGCEDAIEDCRTRRTSSHNGDIEKVSVPNE